MKTRLSRPICASTRLVTLFAGIVAGCPLHAAQIEVNSASDVVAGDGVCTLREAIINANQDSQGGSVDCTAGAGADTITFAAHYTITLDSSQFPAVTSTLVIQGGGADNTVLQASVNNPVTQQPAVATHDFRVFEVAAAGNLSLDGLTVRHGRCSDSCLPNAAGGGGGIINNGVLKISNARVTGNDSSALGGGVRNEPGSVSEYVNVVFQGNKANFGGGMFNYQNSIPVQTGVTFDANAANYGGGVYNYHTSGVTYDGVTFSSNSAVILGGGMGNESASPTIVNTTFSHNTTGNQGGGMDMLGGVVTLLNVTFTGNTASSQGGGIKNFGGTLRLDNVIIANSIGGDCFLDTILPTSVLDPASSHNLIEDAANACGAQNGVNGNLVGIDPQLGGLANNGGSTLTHSLPSGSPAVNAGAPIGCAAKDQRGVTRPQLGTCDIGAFEYKPPAPPVVTGLTLPGALPVLENQRITTGITQLIVHFDQDVLADGGAGAVNNPANHLLARAGGNGFQTSSCAGGVAGDDVAVTINSVAYADGGGAGPFQATLNLNGGSALPLGAYRLFVCGTTSINNANGDELNAGLLDFGRSFSVVESVTPLTVSSIVVDATAPATLYSAVYGVGIYKSTDGGGQWSAAATQPANLDIKALLMESATVLYAATHGGGVFKSGNAGVDWAACATQPGNLNLLSLARSGNGTLYAGSEAGVFASSDGCTSWTAINNGLPN